MLDALDKVPDTLEAQPEGFHARFAITFIREERRGFEIGMRSPQADQPC